MEAQRLKDTAMAKSTGSMGGNRSTQIRRAKAIDPEEVRKQAMALGWPTKTAGVNKMVSKNWDCTPGHIGRILRNSLKDLTSCM